MYLLKVIDAHGNVIWTRLTSGHEIKGKTLEWWREGKWESYIIPDDMGIRVHIEVMPPKYIDVHHTGRICS